MPVLAAFLREQPKVTATLVTLDRVANLIEEGFDARAADRAAARFHHRCAQDRRGAPAPGGEPGLSRPARRARSSPRPSPAHELIAFDGMLAGGEWRFVRDGRPHARPDAPADGQRRAGRDPGGRARRRPHRRPVLHGGAAARRRHACHRARRLFAAAGARCSWSTRRAACSRPRSAPSSTSPRPGSRVRWRRVPSCAAPARCRSGGPGPDAPPPAGAPAGRRPPPVAPASRRRAARHSRRS